MDAFLLAALVGIAVTILALVSSVQLIGERIWYRLRGTLRASAPLRAVNLVIVTIACLLILIVVFGSVGSLHPRGSVLYSIAEFMQSRRFLSVVLGFLFGIFLVFWARQLLLLGENDKVTWLHKGEAIFLVLLLVLGTFAEQISSMAQRLTQLSAAGVTLTFEALKGTTALDRGQSGQGGKTSSGRSVMALGFLSTLHETGGIIDRDRRYIDSINASESAAKAPATATSTVTGGDSKQPPATPEKLIFRDTLAPIAKCLIPDDSGQIPDNIGDVIGANDLLGGIRPTLRELTSKPNLPASRHKTAADKLMSLSNDFITALADTYLLDGSQDRGPIFEHCKELLKLRCPNITADSPADTVKQCINNNAQQTSELRNKLSSALNNDSILGRPYLSLFYASLLWHLDDFAGASGALEKWLANPPTADRRWYEVRIRTTLNIIFEEWLRSTSNPPPLLLSHHLANAKATLDLMENLPPVQNAWKNLTANGYNVVESGFAKRFWNTPCQLTNEQSGDLKGLAITFLRQIMVYAYRATQHPDYFDDYALDVVGRRDQMMTLDLSCIPADTRDLLYAEILQIYGEVEIANAARIAKLPDSGDVRLRLKRAAQAAELGLALVKHPAEQQQEAAKTSLAAVTGEQKAAELKFLLDRVKERARQGLAN